MDRNANAIDIITVLMAIVGGRVLKATWVENSVFWLLQTTALIRVGATMAPMAFYRDAMFISAITWTLSFAIFVLGYWKTLTQPRVDGKPG